MDLCCLFSEKLVVHIWLFSDLCGEMSAPQAEGQISVFMLLNSASTFTVSHEAHDSH